ncbi:MAG: O-antigen ligase family protein [Oscillospiraceae bacterium]|nr:O-antigen ligase family protein [Oscillospiraceae bacterium]
MQLNPQTAAQRLKAHLPLLITILFAIQPLMDILSYWMDRLEYSNTLTLLLRFAVLLAVVLMGFSLSRRKWVYFVTAGVLAALLIGHCACCFYVGYVDSVGDVTNFVRVAQMHRIV